MKRPSNWGLRRPSAGEHHDYSRAALQELRYGKSPRLHWREERPERREKIIAGIACLTLHSVISIHMYDHAKHERARRACLNALLPNLSARPIEQVVIESRGEPKDKIDRAAVTYLRKANNVRRNLVIGWERPTPEPLLWLPDCIGGAVSAWFGEDDDRYYRPLEERIEFIDSHES